MLLITNNEYFKDAIKRSDIKVEYMDIDYIGILKKARDLIHQNYRLVTHPLYGSVKPNETVFRSVILEKGWQIWYGLFDDDWRMYQYCN